MASILIVDDEEQVRHLMAGVLAEIGYDVREAGSGQEGLALYRERPADLVIMDITMPVMDGPEMLKRMREAGNKTPVIMLTSESKRSIISELMKQGIDDYILKPFKPEELRAKVAKSLKLEGAATAGTGATKAALLGLKAQAVPASAPAPAPAPHPVAVRRAAPVASPMAAVSRGSCVELIRGLDKVTECF